MQLAEILNAFLTHLKDFYNHIYCEIWLKYTVECTDKCLL